jgi:hypothetical protein
MEKINSIWDKALLLISAGLILLGVYFSAVYVLNGDIIFQTDIARDFMLMQDMVDNGKLSLIGAKIGPIPGLFHGPLWLYLNLPAFIIGHGNPVAVGWWWVIMGVIFLASTYYFVKQIFGRNTALLVSVFLSSKLAYTSHQLFNPSGAIMFTPALFYNYWKYFQDKKPINLIFTSIILGCLIHFEAAYGVPMTILVIISTLIRAIKTKKYLHPLYFAAILLPLSTYIVFDLRHDFFQLNSIKNFINDSSSVSTSIFQTLSSRKEYIIDSAYSFLVPNNHSWVRYIYLAVFLLSLIAGIKSKGKTALPYNLFIYLFVGFWALTSFYSGRFELYYYIPLQVLSLILFCSAAARFTSIVPIALLTPMLFITFRHSKVAAYSTYDYSGAEASSWQYNLNLAKQIYQDAGSDFGYFILSEDLLAYSPKYALNYASHLYPSMRAYSFEKKPTTYVIISRDTYRQGSIDVRWWEEGQVRISKEPLKTMDYGYYTAKKYHLTDDEIAIPEDPNLVNGLQFR